MDDSIAYIDSLTIDADIPLTEDEARLVIATSKKPSGFVVGGSLVSFVSQISETARKDVLNSTLLAQLVANTRHDRESQVVEWYRSYREVLENVGWTLQGFDFNKVSAAGSSFTADKIVLELISALVSQDQLTIVKATVDALKALKSNDGRLVLFERGSHSARKGNFQVSIASEVGGAVALGMGAFYFSTNRDVTSVLWFSYSSSSTNFYQGSQTMTLNEDVYSRVRELVVKKLGDKAEKYVQELPELEDIPGTLDSQESIRPIL